MTTTFERSPYLERARQLAASYPVLAILGPRQCGKTTLARQGWPELEYLDLELPSDFDKLARDPELYLTTRKRPLILDEAQRLPSLFPLLRAVVDRARRRNGQLILLGSASFTLVESINDSLSGRVGFLDLTPLLAAECVASSTDLDAHWLKGGFPDAYTSGARDELSFDWFDHYVRTLIERDLPALGIELRPLELRRLWAMCAHVHGNALNMNKMAESLGISPHTVRRYLDILEQSFLIRRLQPYHANLKKRLVKSPKLYLRDSGFVHYFLRVMDLDTLLVSPDRGKSFEGYVVEQVLAIARLVSPEVEACYFRTSDQYEVDLVLVRGRGKVLVEVKASLSPDARDVARLTKCMELLGAKRAYFVTLGDAAYPAARGIEVMGVKRWVADGCPPFWR